MFYPVTFCAILENRSERNRGRSEATQSDERGGGKHSPVEQTEIRTNGAKLVTRAFVSFRGEKKEEIKML